MTLNVVGNAVTIAFSVAPHVFDFFFSWFLGFPFPFPLPSLTFVFIPSFFWCFFCYFFLLVSVISDYKNIFSTNDLMATISYTSLSTFNTGNPNNSNSTSNQILNSDILVGNTDEIAVLAKLFPFSPEITEKIIGYAYYLDSPHVTTDNYVAHGITYEDYENSASSRKMLKTAVSSSASNVTRGRYSNLSNLMLVNSGFYFFCLQYQYKYCSFIRSFSFHKFLLNLLKSNELGYYVEYLDFQEFTAVGLGKSVESIFKIPNLTSVTLLKCLQLCSMNLKTLLLNESIDSDISFEVLDFIFNDLKNLKSLDFCGCSNENLISYFDKLTINNENLKLEKLSFHECLHLPTTTYSKILPFIPNLKRLDLSHTQVTLKTLNQFLNKKIRLTHLSLRKCSHLGTFTEFMRFLKHPAICGSNEDDFEYERDDKDNDDYSEKFQLRWLNIQQCFSSDVLTNEKLNSILDIIAAGAPALRYLNLNGFANLNGEHVRKITESFKELESLNISDVNLNFSDAHDLEIIKELNSLKNLKFLDVSSSVWSFEKLKNLITELDFVQAIEIKPVLSDKLLHLLTFSRIDESGDYSEEYWRAYNNKGTSRRCWIHKVKSVEESILIDNYETEQAGGRLVEWDINSGDLLLNKVKKVDWLGLASVKINCCEDIDYPLQDEDFGNDLSVRGLYKYYSLKV